ncbi:hypothetical protein [Erythrobacter rubeus]|uniref:Uncharacterized protein n=1 Tax=Erythrobacter rubeus TaxID=2760803 RepID=A0ABR8KXP4_9SPHN|nr:hypothetical protein [Erythrobacter rubeus]MBD2842997.1 hypothetical protein [Erythrobacter rubeus]
MNNKGLAKMIKTFCLTFIVSAGVAFSASYSTEAFATSFDPVPFCLENADFFGGFEECLAEVTFDDVDDPGSPGDPPPSTSPGGKLPINFCSGRLDCEGLGGA